MTRYTVEADEWAGLSKMVEELGELNQVLGKLMANDGKEIYEWTDLDLRARLIEECGDALAAITFFTVKNLDVHAVDERAATKFKQYNKWRDDLRNG